MERSLIFFYLYQFLNFSQHLTGWQNFAWVTSFFALLSFSGQVSQILGQRFVEKVLARLLGGKIHRKTKINHLKFASLVGRLSENYVTLGQT